MGVVIKIRKKIKPDMIFMVTEYMIALYMAIASIINLLNIAGRMHFYTWFMKPTFYGSSMLVMLLLQYGLMRANKKNKILVKIRPYVMGILAANIISVCNLSLCLMLLLIIGYFLLSGFQKKYSVGEASLTILVICIGIEVYSIVMLLEGSVADNCVGNFFVSAMPDVLFVISTVLYSIAIRNQEEIEKTDNEEYYSMETSDYEMEAAEEFITIEDNNTVKIDSATTNDMQIKKRRRKRNQRFVFRKLSNWVQVNSRRIAFYMGSAVCVISVGLFIYFIVITGIGVQKISGSTESVYLLEHCDDSSLVLTVVQDKDKETCSVGFEKYVGTNNQKVYFRQTWEGIYQIVFLEPECAMEVNEEMALYAAPVTDSPNQTWFKQVYDGEEDLYNISCAYGLPLCYSGVSPDNETASIAIGNVEEGYDLFKQVRTVRDEFITRLVAEYRDVFFPTILMETIYTLIGSWIGVLFVVISLSLFIIIYMRRLIGDKLAALYAAVYIYILAYSAVSAIALLLFAFSLQCYSNYYHRRLKAEAS